MFLDAARDGLNYFQHRDDPKCAAFAALGLATLKQLQRDGPPLPLELPAAARRLDPDVPALQVIGCSTSMGREYYTKLVLPVALQQMLPLRDVCSVVVLTFNEDVDLVQWIKANLQWAIGEGMLRPAPSAGLLCWLCFCFAPCRARGLLD